MNSRNSWFAVAWLQAIVLVGIAGVRYGEHSVGPQPVTPTPHVDPVKPEPDKPAPPPIDPTPPAPNPAPEKSVFFRIGQSYQGVLATSCAAGWKSGQIAIIAGKNPDDALNVVSKSWGNALKPKYDSIIKPEIAKIAGDPKNYGDAEKAAVAKAFGDLSEGLASGAAK